VNDDPTLLREAEPARPSVESMTGDIRTLLPSSWPVVRQAGHALLSCYRLVIGERMENASAFDIFESRILLFWGSLPYTRARSEEILEWIGRDVRFHIDAEETTTVEGNYLVCATPLSPGEERAEAERDARERSLAAVGAVMLQLGENAAHSHVFDNLIGPDGKGVFSVGRFRAPAFAVHDTSTMLAQLAHITETLALIAPVAQPRVQRAIRWLSVGMARDDTDAFLSMWIALELMAMRGSADVRPINERLASQYSVTYREACQRFLVGRLCGIRSAIVHSGALFQVSLHIRLLLRAIFYDCLHNELGRPSRAAMDVLASTDVAAHVSDLSTRLDEDSRLRDDPPCPCGRANVSFRRCHGAPTTRDGVGEPG